MVDAAAPPPGPTPRRVMDEALDEQIARIELRITWVWQLLYLIGIIYALVLYLAGGLRLAAWSAAACAVYLAWFSVEATLRRRRRAPRALIALSVIVESTLPSCFLLLATWTQGAAYALSSWLPPMFFAALVLSSTIRLRPWAPLVLALSSAVTIAAAYALVVRPALPPELMDTPIHGAPVQVARSASMVIAGLLSAGLAVVLRRAISKADMTARERDLFGKYRLEQPIGSGGMGTVFRAIYCPEGGFERLVAVKQIHPHLARQPSFVDAFRREAELSARLIHPSIVQVMDFGRIDDRYFLAMEYVEGLTLAAMMARLRHANVRVEPPLVAQVGREILAGLVYSHTGARDRNGDLLRVVHRDLSPANVLMSTNGEVKIGDFGVARALRDAQSAHTRTAVGHAGYMAPEQAMAEPVDERSDLFSLGVVLWELLCGRPLFDRGAEGPTLLALVNDEVAAPSSLLSVDPAWDELLLRALERNPDRRYSTAAAMLVDLESAAAAHPGSVAGRVSADLAALVVRSIGLPEPPAGEEDEPPFGNRRPESEQSGG
ncbi:MAG: serine/threonine protein kinase [Deltaproteobacteria bacterium]|nr:serine/threonine protein kinase [Deltaproteobacteria bacterium]MBW2531769.1 serine/threonine protein kinase [Deltaproteobacteria bacterium]